MEREEKRINEAGKRIFVKCYMSEENNDWIEKQSKAFGITKSAMVSICIANYKQQCEMTKMMSNFDDMLKRIEKIKEGEK